MDRKTWKSICQEKVTMWLQAEDAVALGQSYVIGDRELTRANLNAIRDELKYWLDQLALVENADEVNGRNKAYRAVLRDV